MDEKVLYDALSCLVTADCESDFRKKIVGREHEADKIKTFIEDGTANPSGRAIVLIGAPGTGKTHTVTAVLEEFANRRDLSFFNCNAYTYLRDSSKSGIQFFSDIISLIRSSSGGRSNSFVQKFEKKWCSESSNSALEFLEEIRSDSGRSLVVFVDEAEILKQVSLRRSENILASHRRVPSNRSEKSKNENNNNNNNNSCLHFLLEFLFKYSKSTTLIMTTNSMALKSFCDSFLNSLFSDRKKKKSKIILSDRIESLTFSPYSFESFILILKNKMEFILDIQNKNNNNNNFQNDKNIQKYDHDDQSPVFRRITRSQNKNKRQNVSPSPPSPIKKQSRQQLSQQSNFLSLNQTDNNKNENKFLKSGMRKIQQNALNKFFESPEFSLCVRKIVLHGGDCRALFDAVAKLKDMMITDDGMSTRSCTEGSNDMLRINMKNKSGSKKRSKNSEHQKNENQFYAPNDAVEKSPVLQSTPAFGRDYSECPSSESKRRRTKRMDSDDDTKLNKSKNKKEKNSNFDDDGHFCVDGITDQSSFQNENKNDKKNNNSKIKYNKIEIQDVTQLVKVRYDNEIGKFASAYQRVPAQLQMIITSIAAEVLGRSKKKNLLLKSIKKSDFNIDEDNNNDDYSFSFYYIQKLYESACASAMMPTILTESEGDFVIALEDLRTVNLIKFTNNNNNNISQFNTQNVKSSAKRSKSPVFTPNRQFTPSSKMRTPSKNMRQLVEQTRTPTKTTKSPAAIHVNENYNKNIFQIDKKISLSLSTPESIRSAFQILIKSKSIPFRMLSAKDLKDDDSDSDSDDE